MNAIVNLTKAVSDVCPIHGVSIGSAEDKATWRIDFKDEASSEQRAAARHVVSEFVWNEDEVPQSVTMRQARLALLQQNLLDSVEAAVAQAGTAAQIEWEYAQELKRDHPLTVSLSAALGLTSQQLDDLFTLAASF